MSAVLIVRDEAGLLGECLQSLRSFADEVVVVDTGSTDGSIKLAEDAGARVAECPWTDDFAAARNFALDLALGEWVLYIDADERLRPSNQAAARQLLSEGGVGFTVDLHPRKGWTAYREYRLWRNKPSIRFRGVIHETVLDSLRVAAGGALDNIPRSGLVIDHVGYEGSLVEKFRRNLPLLQEALAVDPERVFLWHDYGCALAGLGRHVEAERAWGEAIVRSRSSEPSHPPAGHVLSYLSLIARRRDLGQQYDELLDEALARFPDDRALAWWEGRRLLDREATRRRPPRSRNWWPSRRRASTAPRWPTQLSSSGPGPSRVWQLRSFDLAAPSRRAPASSSWHAQRASPTATSRWPSSPAVGVVASRLDGS